MIKALTDTYVLSNGVKIPCIGYGTWQTPDGETARDSVKCALECGYRHIDTAAAYNNEKSVGEGIRLSGVNRHDIFVTTKHWIADRGYDKTILACEKSLSELGMDYVDMYLIHWPCVAKISENWAEINADTWRGFEKLYKDGKIRAIGVSNFLPNHLEALKKVCEIAPMVNQIEYHPGYNQKEVVEYCQANDMLVQAWSPLGCGAVLKDPTVNEIAAKYNRTAAQICIRYAMERNILPLPKSVTPSRIADNTNVFDFTLAAEDMAVLDNMPKTGYSGFYPEEAPADAL